MCLSFGLCGASPSLLGLDVQARGHWRRAAALCPATAPWADGRQSCSVSHSSRSPRTFHLGEESYQRGRGRRALRKVGSGGPRFPSQNFSNRVFKDRGEKLKSKKQKQQAHYSPETSLKGKGGKSILNSECIDLQFGDRIQLSVPSEFLRRDDGVRGNGSRVSWGSRDEEEKPRNLSPSPDLHLLQDQENPHPHLGRLSLRKK